MSGIYKLGHGVGQAIADNVKDLNVQVSDLDNVKATQNNLVTVVKKLNDQRVMDSRTISENFKNIEARLNRVDSRTSQVKSVAKKTPVYAAEICKVTAKGSMYYGPRSILFLVVTVISIAIAGIFYGGRFEQPDLVNAAWLAIYASGGALVPAAALTFITRKRE
jgi:uncharacterized protein YkvS